MTTYEILDDPRKLAIIDEQLRSLEEQHYRLTIVGEAHFGVGAANATERLKSELDRLEGEIKRVQGERKKLAPKADS